MEGRTEAEAREELRAAGVEPDRAAILAAAKTFPGNRPSNTFLYKKLTPHTLGMLSRCTSTKCSCRAPFGTSTASIKWSRAGQGARRPILPRLGRGPVATGDASTDGLTTRTRTFRDSGQGGRAEVVRRTEPITRSASGTRPCRCTRPRRWPMTQVIQTGAATQDAGLLVEGRVERGHGHHVLETCSKFPHGRGRCQDEVTTPTVSPGATTRIRSSSTGCSRVVRALGSTTMRSGGTPNRLPAASWPAPEQGIIGRRPIRGCAGPHPPAADDHDPAPLSKNVRTPWTTRAVVHASGWSYVGGRIDEPARQHDNHVDAGHVLVGRNRVHRGQPTDEVRFRSVSAQQPQPRRCDGQQGQADAATGRSQRHSHTKAACTRTAVLKNHISGSAKAFPMGNSTPTPPRPPRTALIAPGLRR